jgi:Transcription factor WhiB
MPLRTAAAAKGTHRSMILAHLKDHPDSTSWELAKVLGISSRLLPLLRLMERKGEIVARTEWRPTQGRNVSLWKVAPPGTVPSVPPLSPEAISRKRERDRLSQRRRRARLAGADIPPGGEIPAWFAQRPALVVPPGGACKGADPDLFFPSPDEPDSPAKAICAACRIRAECYAVAVANGEFVGIWGGRNFETGLRGRVAS